MIWKPRSHLGRSGMNTKMTETHENGEKSANGVDGDELGFMESYVIRPMCANMDCPS